MTKLRLPIGIQTFRKIREGREYYYVDKTPWIVALIDQGSHFLLSRPRRFGKSLFLDTLKELFEGNEELFKGLHIHNLWDWSERWPVLRLSFEGGDFKEPGHLHANLMAQLDSAARSAGVAAEYNTGPERFARLLETLSRASGRRVVVLVDEYDKPILDALQSPEVAQANGAYLRGLYGVVKDRQKHIRFSFLTGVSKFSMANQFSGLNSLRDVSLDPRHAAICGFTESDLDEVFAAELPGLNRHRVRDWYNGYSWRGEEKIYNPFDVLLLFDSREFKAHWFETGSQKFLLDTLKERGLAGPDLARMTGTDELLSRFDLDDMAPEALLFQTGYLTILEERRLGGKKFYRLGYPNRAVRQSLNEHLLTAMAGAASRKGDRDIRLHELLEGNDLAGLEEIFRSFFASIPHEWHVKNEIARYEDHYASVLYSWFAALDLDVVAEESSGRGRLDMTVRFADRVYLIQFNVIESSTEGAALARLKDGGYARKHLGLGKPVYLIGVEFSARTRNLTGFEVAPA